MDIICKSINNKSYPFNVNIDDQIKSITDILLINAGFDKKTHMLKIIHNGIILNDTQTFSEFIPIKTNIKDPVVFVFMGIKIKTPNIKKLLNTNVNIDNADTNKLRISLIGLLVFIQNNPQLLELFNNNSKLFIHIIMSPSFVPILNKMLDDNSENTTEYVDNLTDYIFDIQAALNKN